MSIRSRLAKCESVAAERGAGSLAAHWKRQDKLWRQTIRAFIRAVDHEGVGDGLLDRVLTALERNLDEGVYNRRDGSRSPVLGRWLYNAMFRGVIPDPMPAALVEALADAPADGDHARFACHRCRLLVPSSPGNVNPLAGPPKARPYCDPCPVCGGPLTPDAHEMGDHPQGPEVLACRPQHGSAVPGNGTMRA